MEIVAFLLLLVLIPLAITSYSFAPWIPIRGSDLERLFKVIKLKKGEIFYELGCGDGRVVYFGAKHFNNRFIGIELNPFFYFWCRLRQQKNTQFILGDLFRADISQADVIYLFGLPRAINGKLKTKLKKEAKPGSRIISYGFMITDWKPVLVDKPDDKHLPIFVYQSPMTSLPLKDKKVKIDGLGR